MAAVFARACLARRAACAIIPAMIDKPAERARANRHEGSKT